jgi:hypothetical protein
MLRISEEYLRMWPRDFFHIKGQQAELRQSLNKPGVYILYRAGTPYYIGQARSLYTRLSKHADIDSRYGNFWDMFSAFIIQDSALRNQIEAILIAAMPTANARRPREFTRVRLSPRLKDAYYGHRFPTQQ